jgi:hypothetical protein
MSAAELYYLITFKHFKCIGELHSRKCLYRKYKEETYEPSG